MARQSQSTTDELGEPATAKRRDEALRRALNTPPKPHDEMKVGKQGKPKKARPDKS